jgi:RND family efflux transporter MFP subunit
MRRLLWLLGLVPVLLAGCKPTTPAAAAPGPPEVKVTTPAIQEVIDYEYFTGHTEAKQKVDLKPNVNVVGYALEEVKFKDGEIVPKGELLFVIDQRLFKSRVATAEASLAQAEAHLKVAESNFARARLLLPRGSISQEDYDLALGNRDEAGASLGVARQNVNQARTNLQYTEIRAPFEGRMSRRLVDPGTTVQTNTILSTIITLNPIYAYFDVDERTMLRLLKESLKTTRDGKVKIDIGLADEQESGKPSYPHVGIVDFVDNVVDQNTGTTMMRGVFGEAGASKTEREVTPGMYIRVRFPVGLPYKAPRIPEEAIGTDQGQKKIFVLNKENKAEYRQVTIGQLENGLRVIKGEKFAYILDEKDPTKYQLVTDPKLMDRPNVIKSDVKPDERIVISGLQRVKAGMEVKPLKADPAPPKDGSQEK